MCRTRIVFIFLVACSSPISAQINRFVVFFTDKIGTEYSINEPQNFLSERSIARRAKNSVQLSENDLPVSKVYLDQLKAAGASVQYTSRWMNCALVECSQAARDAISSFPFVQSLEYVAPGTTAKRQSSVTQSSKKLSTASFQLEMIGADIMHSDGFRGSGVRIAVFDSGFPGVDTLGAYDSLRLRSGIVDHYNFAFNTADVYGFDTHGTDVLSTMAANLGTSFLGVAPDADYLLYVSEYTPTEFRVEEYYWLFAAERADSAGADIISSSLGYSTFDDASMDYKISDLDGNTAVVTRAATLATEKGIIVVNSAGNEGLDPWTYIIPPADGQTVIAVGAVDEQEIRANFSSVGPTADGRVKPDLMAQGFLTLMVNSSGQLIAANGTSFSAPIIAGLFAGTLQAFPELTTQALKEKILSSASQYSNPDNEYGFGIPNYSLIRNLVNEINKNDHRNCAFPNPVTNGKIQIRHDALKNEKWNITITDMMGRVNMQLTGLVSEAGTISIEMPGLGTGVYVISITGPSLMPRYKVMVRN